MKKKFFWMALVALLMAMSSCNNEPLNYPVMYIVNASDYSVKVNCDNNPVVTVGQNSNTKVQLSNVSVNLPVFVEVEYFDSKGNRVKRYTWDSYYFSWNTAYKMTLKNTGGTLQKL